MKNNTKFTKVVCSVSEMSSTLELSRARFYQLMETGIFPQPIYDIRTRRPFFDLELQEQCMRVRQSGIGVNGQYILFYNPRQKTQNSSIKSNRKKGNKYQEFIETLNVMGLEVSGEQVEGAIRKLYPGGIDGEDPGVMVREIFRYLKKKGD